MCALPISLLLFVACLELVPPPDEQDIKLRSQRSAMNAGSRIKMLRDFFPGLGLTVAAYLVLTVMRDIRDNFEEIGRAPSELQSLMRISYAVFCLKKKKHIYSYVPVH